ncbi:MAG: hydrogenase 3 maturation endopeptidase HyCI [Anaerolineales bacterium]
MLHNSWQASLQSLLNQQKANSKIAIVGIGNALRSDDAAGVLVARSLTTSRLLPDPNPVLVIDAGHAPENCTAQLRRFAPDVVLLVDAVEMGEAPGHIRWVEMDEIEGMSASTHSLPLSMLASFLNWELKCEVTLLGIQLKSNAVGEIVHLDVLRAVNEIVSTITEAVSPKLIPA